MNSLRSFLFSYFFSFIIGLSFFISLLDIQFLQAGEVEKLYEASVLVNNEEEKADRKLLLNNVFTKVLHKVTGSEEFRKLPGSKKIIDQSESLVQKFSFRSKQENKTLETNSLPERKNETKVLKEDGSTDENTEQNVAEESSEFEKTWFWARFNKQLTNQLLKENQLPVWDSLRPDTLIWLSIEKSHKRDIVTPSSDLSVIKLLKRTADTRGISLLFPFGDLQDQNKLSMTDLWGNYSQAIQAASIRYHSQAILATRIYQEPSGLWLARWSLYVLDKSENWESRHENLSQLLAQGINSLADRLAMLFALRTDSLNDKVSVIQINNVTDFNGFVRVSDYFKRISAIQSVNLLQVKGDSLSYRIHYFGDEHYLIQSLVLGEVLQKVESSGDSLDKDNQNNHSEYVSVLLDEVKPDQKKLNLNESIQADTSTKIINNEADLSRSGQGSKLEVKPRDIQPDVEFWLAR
jgi:hypothetical protein